MSTQTLFEVHTLKGGQWQVDSTYQNRDEAIEVARGLFGEKVFQGVKVIQDKYDPRTGDNRESVIYDSNKQVKPRPTPTQSSEEAAPAAVSRPAPTSGKGGEIGWSQGRGGGDQGLVAVGGYSGWWLGTPLRSRLR
ncbi:MAG: hypothetical protein ISP41_04055 [Alphaproteobacteria bacterium]|nr:hypothetical protein [Alphaproteobacteria bacterium]